MPIVVINKDEVNKVLENLPKEFSSIDVLINNAGNAHGLDTIQDGSLDDWDNMIDINVKGLLYVSRVIMPKMIEQQSGHIINIGSLAGREVYERGNIYCATKHAVTAFSEGLRQELSVRKNIRVTSIEPGVVQTELTNTITEDSLQGFIEKGKQMEALQADDISNAIIFAIDAPNHMNVNEILIRPTTQDH